MNFNEKNIDSSIIIEVSGDLDLDKTDEFRNQVFEAFDKGYPLGRINTSEDIAAAAVWLSSDECYMTGENLQVNGGLCLRGNPTSKDIQESVAKHMQS